MVASNNSRDARFAEGKQGAPPIARRRFLASVGVFTWFGSVFLALVGSLRSALPAVLPDPSAQFKIGMLRDFAPGVFKTFQEENVMVFCDEKGLYAISIVCTHLGCVVQHTDEGFQCPCHGSKYGEKGELLQGPAPKGLPWFSIAQLPGGHLIVDRSKAVRQGTKFDFDGTKA